MPGIRMSFKTPLVLGMLFGAFQISEGHNNTTLSCKNSNREYDNKRICFKVVKDQGDKCEIQFKEQDKECKQGWKILAIMLLIVVCLELILGLLYLLKKRKIQNRDRAYTNGTPRVDVTDDIVPPQNDAPALPNRMSSPKPMPRNRCMSEPAVQAPVPRVPERSAVSLMRRHPGIKSPDEINTFPKPKNIESRRQNNFGSSLGSMKNATGFLGGIAEENVPEAKNSRSLNVSPERKFTCQNRLSVHGTAGEGNLPPLPPHSPRKTLPPPPPEPLKEDLKELTMGENNDYPPICPPRKESIFRLDSSDTGYNTSKEDLPNLDSPEVSSRDSLSIAPGLLVNVIQVFDTSREYNDPEVLSSPSSEMKYNPMVTKEDQEQYPALAFDKDNTESDTTNSHKLLNKDRLGANIANIQVVVDSPSPSLTGNADCQNLENCELANKDFHSEMNTSPRCIPRLCRQETTH